MSGILSDDPGKRRRELRNFGILMFVALGAIGGFLFWRHKDIYIYFLAAAGAFLVLGFAWPNALVVVYIPWMKFAAALGWINTRILLGIIFFGIFTPMALILRLIRKDLLSVNWNRKSDSYWLDVNNPEPNPETYERMF